MRGIRLLLENGSTVDCDYGTPPLEGVWPFEMLAIRTGCRHRSVKCWECGLKVCIENADLMAEIESPEGFALRFSQSLRGDPR